MVRKINARTRGLLLALASIVLLTVAGCGGGPQPDENDPWQVVTAYIDAVNASDSGAIADLVDPAYDAKTDIDSRIKRLGGRSLHYTTLQFHGTGMPDLTSVDLTLASGNGGSTETYQDSLPLARSKSRWYLVIGHHR
jgi:hypothetical protein